MKSLVPYTPIESKRLEDVALVYLICSFKPCITDNMRRLHLLYYVADMSPWDFYV